MVSCAFKAALPFSGNAEGNVGTGLTKGISLRLGESQTLFAEEHRAREVSLYLGQRRRGKEGIDADAWGRGGVRGQCRLEPFLALMRLAPGIGEGEDSPGQAQHRFGLPVCQLPGDSGTQVGPFERQALYPLGRSRRDEVRRG